MTAPSKALRATEKLAARMKTGKAGKDGRLYYQTGGALAPIASIAAQTANVL